MITYEPCPCGRTTARLHKIMGRSDDMLVIRGVNVFPSQIEKILLSTPGLGANYEIIVTTENFMDKVEVMVEVADVSLLEQYKELEVLESCGRLSRRTV